MSTEYTERLELDHEYSLSILFNCFIFMQLFNEINCRRIKVRSSLERPFSSRTQCLYLISLASSQDEYDMYAGLHKSIIFMSVIAITVFLQVIIMQFLGLFFKVVPQLWQEWLIAAAVGFTSSLLSWAQRFITRNIGTMSLGNITELRRGGRAAVAQGRTASGKNSLQRVGSIVAGDMGGSMRAAPGMDGKWGAGGGSGRESKGGGSVRQSPADNKRANSGRTNSGNNIVQPFVHRVSQS